MSDPTSPSFTYTITLLSFGAGGAELTPTTWQVAGSFVESRGESVAITDATGNVVALAPFGAVVTRNDAVVTPTPATASTASTAAAGSAS